MIWSLFGCCLMIAGMYLFLRMIFCFVECLLQEIYIMGFVCLLMEFLGLLMLFAGYLLHDGMEFVQPWEFGVGFAVAVIAFIGQIYALVDLSTLSG